MRWVVTAVWALAPLSACTNTVPPKPKMVPRYSILPPRENLPPYFTNTVFEKTETQNLGPLLASNYSLIVNLDGTGDSTAPTPVRQYIIKQMAKRGFGSALLPGYENAEPEEVLKDKRVAIVRVDGLVPVGSRKGQFFDVQVSALDTGGNTTSSLAHGQLYSVDLSRSGGDPRNPGQEVQVEAVVSDSPVFVNPAYELDDAPQTPAAKQSL
ncbi:MAG: flagellar basal body P-ring protein FlgI, partial [Phycisphaerae bacterium]|nr:flagellar basal body P-ring protein FlgI [Phycisphaerae bacterium]